MVGSGDEDGVLACAVTTMLRDEAVVWSGDEVRPKRGAAVRCRQQKGKGAAMAVLQDTAHRMAQERSAGTNAQSRRGVHVVCSHICGTSVLLSSQPSASLTSATLPLNLGTNSSCTSKRVLLRNSAGSKKAGTTKQRALARHKRRNASREPQQHHIRVPSRPPQCPSSSPQHILPTTRSPSTLGIQTTTLSGMRLLAAAHTRRTCLRLVTPQMCLTSRSTPTS